MISWLLAFRARKCRGIERVPKDDVDMHLIYGLFKTAKQASVALGEALLAVVKSIRPAMAAAHPDWDKD